MTLVGKIITVLLITGAIGGGYFYYQQNIKPQENAQAEKTQVQDFEKNTEKTAPVAVQIDTSNWKTYSSDKDGFEVKYPADLEVRSRTSNDISFYSKQEIDNGTSVYENLFDILVDNDPNIVKGYIGIVENEPNYSISGLTANRHIDAEYPSVHIEKINFVHGSSAFTLRLRLVISGDANLAQKYPSLLSNSISTFNQFAATFKFIK